MCSSLLCLIFQFCLCKQKNECFLLPCREMANLIIMFPKGYKLHAWNVNSPFFKRKMFNVMGMTIFFECVLQVLAFIVVLLKLIHMPCYYLVRDLIKLELSSCPKLIHTTTPQHVLDN